MMNLKRYIEIKPHVVQQELFRAISSRNNQEIWDNIRFEDGYRF